MNICDTCPRFIHPGDMWGRVLLGWDMRAGEQPEPTFMDMCEDCYSRYTDMQLRETATKLQTTLVWER